jgi:hypothetical protein
VNGKWKVPGRCPKVISFHIISTLGNVAPRKNPMHEGQEGVEIAPYLAKVEQEAKIR